MNTVPLVCRLRSRRSFKSGGQRIAFAGATQAKVCCKRTLYYCRSAEKHASGSPELKWPMVQDQTSFKASVSEPGPKQLVIKTASRARRGKNKQTPTKRLPDLPPVKEIRTETVAAPIAAARRAKFAERLHDAQRIEDLFEVNCCATTHHTAVVVAIQSSIHVC